HANALGFENFVTMSLEARMAGGIDNIRTMVNTLHMRSEKAFDNDLKTLTSAAANDNVESLEVWDIDYYIKQVVDQDKKKLAKKLQNLFTFDSVLSGMINMVSRLFQVEIQEVPKEKFQSWHP